MPTYNNKIVLGDEPLIDLTSDTVTPEKVLSGETFHDRSGAPQTGSLTTHTYTAGDGIVIENDEISTDNMPAADMAEIVNPLPSVMSRLPILFDEQGEERVVGWYRYSDGTKKKVYEKTYSVSSVSSTSKLVDSSMKLSNVTLVGFINNGVALGGNYNGTTFQGAIGTGMHFRIWNDATGGLYCNIEGGGSVTATQARFSVQYTKTTDTPV